MFGDVEEAIKNFGLQDVGIDGIPGREILRELIECSLRGESVKIEYREREIPVMEVFTELMKEYQQKEGKDNE